MNHENEVYLNRQSVVFSVVYRAIRHVARHVEDFIRIIVYSFRYITVLILMMMAFNSISAQNIITLQKCHQQSDSLFPLVAQKLSYNQIDDLSVDNLKSAYLPTLDFNAKATYQSKVTEISIPLSGLGVESPTVPHTQYGATIDIKQIIYDGGIIKQRKSVTGLQTQTELQQVELDMYKLKEQINQLYFATLTVQENFNVIVLAQESIIANRKVMESSVSNGVVNPSALDNMDAELLKLDQQLIELKSKKLQLVKALSFLSCMPIALDDSLLLPDLPVISPNAPYRPEHKLFDQQTELLQANIKLTADQRRPKVMAFGSAGMGYPGLNMFSDALEPYYIVGGQITWNIWDWKQTSRNKEILSIQQQLITDSRAVFDQNLNIKISDAQIAQDKLAQLIKKDEEIIILQERISLRSASQLANGTITPADYLNDVNAEKQARINLVTHKIQLVQAKIDACSLNGQPLF